MIKIVKEKSEKYVTKGAYENFYKPLGYSITNDGNKEHKREVTPEIKDEKIKKSKENVVKDNEYKGEKKSQKFEEFKKR